MGDDIAGLRSGLVISRKKSRKGMWGYVKMFLRRRSDKCAKGKGYPHRLADTVVDHTSDKQVRLQLVQFQPPPPLLYEYFRFIGSMWYKPNTFLTVMAIITKFV